MRYRAVSLVLAVVMAVATVAPAGAGLAQSGGWGGTGWGGQGWGGQGWGGQGSGGQGRESPGWGRPAVQRDQRAGGGNEGRVSVERFVSNAPLATELGHGTILVSSQSPGASYLGEPDRAAFEAAMVDRLIKAGYETAVARSVGGQLAVLTVSRQVIEPAEAKQPVHGSAAMEVGSRGSAYGLALDVDLSKPLPALLSTRLEARIRDRATDAVLWEGRAAVATREGDPRWSDQAIAAKLAAALFDGFPHVSDGLRARG